MACEFIMSNGIGGPSSLTTNMRECINHCATTALNPSVKNYAGITSISATDLTLACFCRERYIAHGTPDSSQCRPCPDGSGYLCGSHYGTRPPLQSVPVKSIVFYEAIFQPIDIVAPLPGPQPPSPSSPPSDSSPPSPPRPENPDPRPIIIETSGPGNTDPADPNSNENPNSPINNPSHYHGWPSEPRRPRRNRTSSLDGSVTARPETIFNVIQNTAIQPNNNNPLQSGLGVPPAASSSPVESNTTPSTAAMLAGGFGAALLGVAGAAVFFFAMRRSRRNKTRDTEKSFKTADGRFGNDFKDDGGKKAILKEPFEEFALRGDGTIVGRDGTVHTIVQRDGTVLTVVQKDATVHGNTVVHRNDTALDRSPPPASTTRKPDCSIQPSKAPLHPQRHRFLLVLPQRTSSSRSAKDEKADVFPEKSEKYNKAIEAGFVAVPGRARRAGGRLGRLGRV
ncbi:hypothetical protein BC829DRAFT_489105 [Chytridium lagenaria]|nr:hypothetical protein BC829DRAFT_489105 [Chytridium lagenaria]